MSPLKDLIQYRQARARETLEDARCLLAGGGLNSAVNRTYYALFYEVTALLLTHSLSSAKHSGIRSLFHEHFVKTGKASKESGRFYSRMFDFRQKADYIDYFTFERDQVENWIESADNFIEEINQLIDREINASE